MDDAVGGAAQDFFRGVTQQLDARVADVEDLAAGVQQEDEVPAVLGDQAVLFLAGAQGTFRTSFLIHRRLLERQQFENTAEQLELLFDEIGVRRRTDHAPEAIVFVDLSGFTRLTEELGDEQAAERSRELANVVRAAAVRNRGRVIKLLGDGAMVHFPSATDAVAGASAVIELAERAGLPAARAGVTVGALIRRDGDYFGHTVNLASRICDAAAASSVTAIREVADLTPELSWTPIGDATLKGVPDPVPLMRLMPG